MGEECPDPKRQKVSSFILDNPISCAPISCTIEKSVDTGVNTLPLYTNSATSSTHLVSSQSKPSCSSVDNLVGEGFPKGVVIQGSLVNKELQEFRVTGNEMPDYFLKFFCKSYNIPNTSFNGALVPEHIQMFLKPMLRSISNDDSLINPFKLKPNLVRPLMSDLSFSVWLNHINCNLKIEEIPDQVFHIKRPFKSRVYTSLRLVRESLRSMLLLSPAISIVLESKNCIETTYFMNDTYFASIKCMCMSYVFLLNQLRHLCFPKGSAYASLRYICNKPLSQNSLWNISKEERKAIRNVSSRLLNRYHQRPRFPARRGQWQGRRRFSRRGLRSLNRGGFNTPHVPSSKASTIDNSVTNLDFLYNDIDKSSCSISKLYISVRENKSNWKILQNEFVQGLVEEGLKIFIKNENADKVISMFRTSPKESKLSGNHFGLAKEQISEFLTLKVIEEIPKGNYVFSTIFVVIDESRSTKHRLIFNMKPLNENLASKSFTMVNQTDVIEMVKDFSHAGVVDISKAYFHIGIHRDYQKYFVFAFNRKIYKFLVMPFGLSTAPYLFTKFTSPIWEYLRSNYQIPIISYIDDILILGRDFEECQKFLNITVNFLVWLGFKINPKSLLSPQQSFTYLGMQFNLKDQTVANTDKNISRCIAQSLDFSGRSHCTLKDIQSLLGRINFCQNFVFNSRVYSHEIIRFFHCNFFLRAEGIAKVTLELLQLYFHGLGPEFMSSCLSF